MLRYLQLLQLADSALPIGTLAHSFGLESMVSEQHLSLNTLFPYFSDLLEESLLLDAVYCRAAHAETADIPYLNQRFSAVRLARESRMASLVLGKRFLKLAAALELSAAFEKALAEDEMHIPVAFGLACGVLAFEVEQSVMAYLHQSVLGLISALQRLMALGQVDASRLAWDLKPAILETVRKSAGFTVESAGSFCHLPELASMRHTVLTTRLFIS